MGDGPVPGAVLDDAIVRTVWLTADEIRARAARHRSPMLLAGITDYLAGSRYPLALVQAHASVLRIKPMLSN